HPAHRHIPHAYTNSDSATDRDHIVFHSYLPASYVPATIHAPFCRPCYRPCPSRSPPSRPIAKALSLPAVFMYSSFGSRVLSTFCDTLLAGLSVTVGTGSVQEYLAIYGSLFLVSNQANCGRYC